MYVCLFSIAGNAALDEEREREGQLSIFGDLMTWESIPGLYSTTVFCRPMSFMFLLTLYLLIYSLHKYRRLHYFTSHELLSSVNQYILYDQTKKETSTYQIKKYSITFNIFSILHFRRLECLSVAPIK